MLLLFVVLLNSSDWNLAILGKYYDCWCRGTIPLQKKRKIQLKMYDIENSLLNCPWISQPPFVHQQYLVEEIGGKKLMWSSVISSLAARASGSCEIDFHHLTWTENFEFQNFLTNSPGHASSSTSSKEFN